MKSPATCLSNPGSKLPIRQIFKMVAYQSQSDSHSLAASAIVNTERAKPSDDQSVYDLGWNDESKQDAKPWVRGMDNEDLWVLVRRLNKVFTRSMP